MKQGVSSLHSIILLSLLLTLLPLPVSAVPTEASVAVPGTQISLTAPKEFVLAENFPGFQNPEERASIMVTEMLSPYSKVRTGMTKEGFASRGITLVSSDETEFSGHKGLLISATQEIQSIVIRKWIAIFGSEKKTILLTASYPGTAGESLGSALKQALLSTRWSPEMKVDHFEGLTYRITESRNLKIAARMSNMLMLSKGGVKPPIPPSEPFLVVAQSISDTAIEDVEAFAKQRIMQTAQVKNISEITGGNLQIANLPSFELTAQALDQETSTPLIVYQVVVKSAKEYFLVQGLVGKENAEEYLPQFRAIASSLELGK